MKNRILLLTIISLVTVSCFAMFNDYEPSSRARGMSGAVTSFSDDYSAIFYNPAGIKYAGSQVGAGYYKLFGNDFSEITTASGTFATSKFGSFGFGVLSHNVEYYDVNLMTEKTFSLGHSFYLNKDIHSEISFGYSANLYSLSYHELGEQINLGVNAGVIAVLHQRTRLGFMLKNINKPTMGDEHRYEIPQQLALGISYIPYQGVITAIDLKKNFEGDTELRTGVEVEIHPLMCIRAGIRNNPASYSFGASFKIKGMMLDYALSTHSVLDMTHHFALGYKF
ncbi:MAG: hypothetical protein M0Q94_00875 [Candidatus Cloacimonetes bacterium]|jgi:hypothetical protein|nr:hypothetical protein [Candidatus Cloacimonadota bacterium]